MRFLLAVMAVSVVLSVGVAAQKTRPYNAKSSGAKNEPKSTAPPPKAAGAGSSSKDLQRVENEQVKGGRSGQGQRTRVAAVPRSERSNNNPSINFNGKGGHGNTGNRNPGSLKGRLKQKGQGKQH
ncbi:MAG: hypothetical protein WA609_02345 [Terriglobales bacterium]